MERISRTDREASIAEMDRKIAETGRLIEEAREKLEYDPYYWANRRVALERIRLVQVQQRSDLMQQRPLDERER